MKGDCIMEILVLSSENCAEFTDDGVCKVFSACIVDWPEGPCDPRAQKPCFFFWGCTADQ